MDDLGLCNLLQLGKSSVNIHFCVTEMHFLEDVQFRI